MPAPAVSTWNRCQGVLLARLPCWRGILFAEEPDISPKGDQVDRVLGLTTLDGKDPRRIAECELLNLGANLLGDDKMTELVDQNQDAKNDDP